MAVDPLFAQWLQAEADYALCADAAATARWGRTALLSERVTGIASAADAEVEGNRQLAFFSRGPFAIEMHDVEGTGWKEEIGSVITMIGPDLGYQSGLDVFVIGIDSDPSANTSRLTVIRPLRPVA